MNILESRSLPHAALLAKYKSGGAYTDCYYVDVPQLVTQERYIEAFYTSRLFKKERFVLGLIAARPSTDAQARRLAAGGATKFAAWSVEAQEPHQLLLRDFLGRTRSWLMSMPSNAGCEPSTRLYFGSAFLPKTKRGSSKPQFGFGFYALRGFHGWYSKALLKAASAGVLRDPP